jgi:hypothetical protein
VSYREHLLFYAFSGPDLHTGHSIHAKAIHSLFKAAFTQADGINLGQELQKLVLSLLLVERNCPVSEER